MTEEPIHCLIVDDNKDVLEKLTIILEKPAKFNLGSKDIFRPVDVRTVSIDCSCQGGRAVISQTSIEALFGALAEPTDFIFTDFAFIADPSANEAFKKAQKTSGEQISIDHCRPFSAYLTDVAQANTGLSKLLADFTGVVVIYTNSAPPFDQLFRGREMTSRMADFALLFPKAADISIYNLHEALKPDAIVVDGMSIGEFKVLMSNVLAKHLETTLWKSTFCELVTDQHRRRKKFSKTSIAWITTVGIALGATTALFGDGLYHELKHIESLFGAAPYKDIFREFGVLFSWLFLGFAVLFTLARIAANLLEKLIDKLYPEGNS